MLTAGKYAGIAIGVVILIAAYAEQLDPRAYLLIAFAYLAGAAWGAIMRQANQ